MNSTGTTVSLLGTLGGTVAPAGSPQSSSEGTLTKAGNSSNTKEFSSVLAEQQQAPATPSSTQNKPLSRPGEGAVTAVGVTVDTASIKLFAQIMPGNALPLEGLGLPVDGAGLPLTGEGEFLASALLADTEQQPDEDTGEVFQAVPLDGEAASGLIMTAMAPMAPAVTMSTEGATVSIMVRPPVMATAATRTSGLSNPIDGTLSAERQEVGIVSSLTGSHLLASEMADQRGRETTLGQHLGAAPTDLAGGAFSNRPAVAAGEGAPLAAPLVAQFAKSLEGNAMAAAQAVAGSGADIDPAALAGAAAAAARGHGEAAVATTSPNLTVPVTVGKPGWSDAVTQQVMWMSSQGMNQAEIALDPPELGPLQVRISTQGEHTHVSFTSAHGVVRDALDQGLPRLRDLLENQGINLVDVDVSDQHQQRRSAAGDNSAQPGDQHGDGGRDEVAEVTDDVGSSASHSTRMTVPRGLVDHFV